MELYAKYTDSISYRHILDTEPNAHAYHLHSHPEAELMYLISGECLAHVEGTAYHLSPGDVMICRPMESHYIEKSPEVPYERITMYFPLELFSAFSSSILISNAYLVRTQGTRNIFTQHLFSTNYAKLFLPRIERQNGDMYIKNFLMALLTEIGEIYANGLNKMETEETIEHNIINYINHNLAEPLTTEMLAKKFFISISQMERKFKKATNETVGSYINIKRMLGANQMIADGIRPTEAAARMGFTDYSSFYRAYRKFFGTSPNDKKKQSAPNRKKDAEP